LCLQFFERYQHHHSSWTRLNFSLAKLPQNIKDNGFIAPPQCMPDYCKIEDDAIMGYRNYYIREKSYMARWNFTPEPIWYTIGMAAEAA